ncbi:Dipeptidyl aminopeptidase/acylaminoacyl peptidase [Muriicola jejuensis]|uniref:Prolyl oligopeptidase family serine peptidase n=1 Tax=Muriicola jejuensis TaxID=504488 RepID=A0A6P0UBJ2_9FLAO|nr:prolyl oligopeptidase family serine peptidase [Muriicola jejuensis]NER09982.1 prolyl oligopeptidase family serine peptidase [Muriicola jejuensis]SMP04129.1 Dipeptidyl aminopeptidase/acylaminoacyl peptidase [Muriicola jejuensis]
MKALFTSLFLIITITLSAQKKSLEISDIELWNTIETPRLAPNGAYVAYSLEKGEKDQTLYLSDANGKELFTYPRASKGAFTDDSKALIFSITAWKDSVMDMKRRKVKKKDMPKDSLGIYHLNSGKLEKIANVQSYKVPEDWSGYIAYQLEEIEVPKDSVKDASKDSTANKDKKKKGKEKKVSKKNGYHLVLRSLESGAEDTIKFVTDYTFAKKGKALAWATTGENDSANAAVYVLDLVNNTRTLLHEAKKADYSNLRLSESGKHLGFVVDTDTTKVQLRPRELYHWQTGMAKAEKLAGPNTPDSYRGDLRPSPYQDIRFSKDESKLYFGLALRPVIKDTMLLDEEISSVEVWTYDEPRLYTVQEMDLKNDTTQAYLAVVHLDKSKRILQLANEAFPESGLTDHRNAPWALLMNEEPYALESQWTGQRARDYAVVNVNTGARKPILKKMAGRIDLSPKASFVYGYSNLDSLWFTYDIEKDNYLPLTKGKVFYDETNDSPTPPYPYGSAGVTEDDKALILYDRYDLWSFNPRSGAPTRLTTGRENKTVYRYVSLNPEVDHINTKEPVLLRSFNEADKSSGYALLDIRTRTIKPLLSGPYDYSDPTKAEKGSALLFTRESFQEFPDLRLANADFSKVTRISNANPQQSDYNWGTIELVNWTSLDGIELTGMLVKPENFDPNKKYPLLVNFYERSSDGLHRHRTPRFERSSINYSFYTSRGYVIFNPDVHYRIGYPGESAFNCVIPGVTALVEKGFIDKDNIGVQGHSWGGYQIAYLVTKTDIFKAAEAGAPVPNMISAYGGIRWWTGLSRQFQYEHTQSRIGGTPWEYPTRYLENSPIFNIDKINTPLLVMHNDADGHVPWYQGIEFFTALRRLGKPSWFLNYNGEPHWPLKLANRKDFNTRMAQFFDYYLKGDPKPVWMERGVPPMEKGINQGLELLPASVD